MSHLYNNITLTVGNIQGIVYCVNFVWECSRTKLDIMKNFKVNPKYTHFAVRKTTGKIVNGWEQSEDIKFWGKLDLADIFPEAKFSEFKLVTIDRKTAKIDFYRNWDNWEKNI